MVLNFFNLGIAKGIFKKWSMAVANFFLVYENVSMHFP